MTASIKRTARAPLRAPLAIVLGAVAASLFSGVGSPTTTPCTGSHGADSSRAGSAPAYGVPIAPTPHPLVELLGVVLSPLGPRAVEDVTVALGFLALSACGWVVYALGGDGSGGPPARSRRCSS